VSYHFAECKSVGEAASPQVAAMMADIETLAIPIHDISPFDHPA